VYNGKGVKRIIESRNVMRIVRELLNWVIYIIIIVILTILINTFVGQRTHVIGNSMEPTLSWHDNLIVDKISYRFTDPSRFDIIVFPFYEEGSVYYIKRIIGLPGETVQIIDGVLYINGVFLNENFGAETIENPGIAASPIHLGADEYFVLGDNRNHSSDSREPRVGVRHRNDFTGRAWLRIWPLDDFGLLQHD
jgi:signal peptidase I